MYFPKVIVAPHACSSTIAPLCCRTSLQPVEKLIEPMTPLCSMTCILAGVAGVLSLAGIAALSQPASAGGLSPVSNSDKWAGVSET